MIVDSSFAEVRKVLEIPEGKYDHDRKALSAMIKTSAYLHAALRVL